MANKHRGHVLVEIGGEEYILLFNWNAIAQLEQRIGASIADIFGGGRLGFHTVREALIVGLSNKHNGRGVARAIQNELQLSDFAYYVEKLMEAFEAAGLFSAGDADDDGVGEDPAPRRGKAAKESTTTNSSD